MSGHAVELVRLLKLELATTRNDMAHNPVMMNLFVHKLTGDILTEQSIANIRAGRIITLPDAREFAAKVEGLAGLKGLMPTTRSTSTPSCCCFALHAVRVNANVRLQLRARAS